MRLFRWFDQINVFNGLCFVFLQIYNKINSFSTSWRWIINDRCVLNYAYCVNLLLIYQLRRSTNFNIHRKKISQFFLACVSHLKNHRGRFRKEIEKKNKCQTEFILCLNFTGFRLLARLSCSTFLLWCWYDRYLSKLCTATTNLSSIS